MIAVFLFMSPFQRAKRSAGSSCLGGFGGAAPFVFVQIRRCCMVSTSPASFRAGFFFG
jgi:hypothetical protein